MTTGVRGGARQCVARTVDTRSSPLGRSLLRRPTGGKPALYAMGMSRLATACPQSAQGGAGREFPSSTANKGGVGQCPSPGTTPASSTPRQATVVGPVPRKSVADWLNPSPWQCQAVPAIGRGYGCGLAAGGAERKARTALRQTAHAHRVSFDCGVARRGARRGVVHWQCQNDASAT